MATQSGRESRSRKFFGKFFRRGTSRSPGATAPSSLNSPSILYPQNNRVTNDSSRTRTRNDIDSHIPPVEARGLSERKNGGLETIQPRGADDHVIPQKEGIDSLLISGSTDESNIVSSPRGPSLQIQQASDGSHQPASRPRPPRLDSKLLSVSHRPRGSSVGSMRSSLLKKAPSQIIEEPRLNHILPEANDISCTLTVTYNNQSHWEDPPRFESFAWDRPGTYEKLIARVKMAQEAMQKIAKTGHTVRLYYGAFRIVGQDYEYSEKINALTQLEEVTIRRICGFIYYHPKQRFRLEYFVDYSSVRTQRIKGRETYSAMVREEVTRLMNRNKNFNNQKFIPRNDRDQFASKEIISGIIAEKSNMDLTGCEALSNEIIREGATGLFLACVTADLPMDQFRRLFKEQGYNDDKLPPISENCCTDREDEDYRGLVEHIHAFFAKTIEGGGRHMDLEDHDIMPVLHVTGDSTGVSTRLGSGAVGYVCKVRIESGHHNLPGHNRSHFALKKIYEKNKQAFERERAMLSRLRKQRHPHIVRHIMSWCQQGTYYILYPLATDNLRSYMHDTPPPKVSWPSVRWFLRQICGLVSAVHHIHEQQEQDETLEGYSSTPPPSIDPRTFKRLSNDSVRFTKMTGQRIGFHHDLKPENILIFEQREGINPVFKISDFGAGKFKDIKDEEKSHEASNLGGTASYFGPEWEQGRSRPFDIWAMACVLTELVIWFLQDAKLEDFHKGRMQASANTPGFAYDYYWVQDGSKRRLKEIVSDSLIEIEDNCNLDFSRSLPAGALKGLPSTINACFAIDPRERLRAGKLHDVLQQMTEGAEVAGEEVEISVHTPSTLGSRHSQDDILTRLRDEPTNSTN